MSPIVWNVEPEIFKIGSYALRWYSLLFGGGFVAGHYMAQRMWTQEGRDPREVDTMLVVAVMGAVAGAALVMSWKRRRPSWPPRPRSAAPCSRD